MGYGEIISLIFRTEYVQKINKTVEMFTDADEFTSVCLDAISILKKQEALHVEAAALSRLFYRMKSKLRCDKGFKFMAKVDTLYSCMLSIQSCFSYVKLM